MLKLQIILHCLPREIDEVERICNHLQRSSHLLNEDDKVNRINLSPHDPALLMINHIRDESHRFAIKNHRHKRALNRNTSSLENVKGIGVNQRRALLNYFGGLQEIKKASIDELQKVVGINYKLATKIQEILKNN